VKIDNSVKSVPGSSITETRTRGTGKAAESAPASSSESVQLSGVSAQLQSTGEAAPFDVSRVSQIKQAIADGKFQINAGAIADRLISSARELVDAQRRG
jgi:negative regulator of flagellin synthesis FlgM